MNWVIISILVTLCLAEGNVLVLTDATFQETIQKNPIVMVKFFAPWCGHCQSFAPEYEKAARMAKEKKLPYVLAELDATEHKVTAEQQNINGFPVVKLFSNGRVIEYNGERTAEALISFLGKNTGPISTELKTVEEIKAQGNTDGLKCIFVTSDNETMKTYTEVAKSEDNYLFFHAEHKIVKEVYPKAMKGDVILLKDFEDRVVLFQNILTAESLKDFLIAEVLPIVNNMTQKVVEQVFKAGGRIGVLLFRTDEDTRLGAYEREFAGAAKTLKSKNYVFVTTNKDDDWGKRLTEFLGIEDQRLPLILIVRRTQDGTDKYLYNGEISKEAVETFVKNYAQGTIPPYYKSESIPTTNPGPVYKVVSKTFKHEVLDNDDDVMVKFYAPWCGHCKKLAPIYERLAEAMRINRKVKFVEIDATKNDIEGHSINGFPIVKFFPGKNKANAITYDDERTEQKMAKFIKERSSYTIAIPDFPINYYEQIEIDDL